MKTVVISQHRLLHYRMELFRILRDSCASNGIDLRLLHGQPTRREVLKTDVGSLPWADVVTNKYIEIAGRDWLWQPTPKHLKEADLFILMQENRLLSNYPKIFRLTERNSQIAYWGHGKNFQSQSPNGLKERWKRATLGKVDWWFAYTDSTRDIVASQGYDPKRITVLNNAMDNDGFNRDLSAISAEDISRLQQQLELADGAPLGIFCGSLYEDKRLDFLIDACDIIHSSRPDFRLAVIGDGPSSQFVKDAAAERPWMKAVGQKRGIDKAVYFKRAQIVLNPGLVGLHVLDAFCAGLPMFTTSDAMHSPEISYLEHGENGIICPGDTLVYANAVLQILENSSELESLQRAAKEGASRYTLKNMCSNFVDGIQTCLSNPIR